jgi:hypothetical protein
MFPRRNKDWHLSVIAATVALLSIATVVPAQVAGTARDAQAMGVAQSVAPSFDQTQQIEQNKAAFVNDLLGKWAQAASDKGYDAYWQKGFRNLVKRSAADLLTLSNRAQDFDTFDKLVFQGFVTNKLGELTQDLVFVPLPPCRLLDTRVVTNTAPYVGPLAPGTQMTLSVNDSLGPQGGLAAGCGVSNNDPPALAIVVTAVPADGNPGNLRTFPTGGAVPTASLVTYGNGVVIASGAITQSCTACTDELTVRNQGAGTTHVVIDVAGYFEAATFGTTNGQVWASAKINGTTPSVTRSFNNAGTGVTVSSLGTGAYEVDFGTDVSGRSYAVTPSAADAAAVPAGACGATTRFLNANAVFVTCRDSAGSALNRDFMIQVF